MEDKQERSVEEDVLQAYREANEPVDATVGPEEADEVEDTPKAEDDADAAIDGEEEATDDLTAPANWDAERKAAFDALPTAEAKQTYMEAIKNVERGFQKKSERLSESVKEHEQIVGLLQPFEAQLNAAGLDRVTAIRQLVGAQQLLTQNPLQGLSQLVQQYGGQNAAAIIQQLAQHYGVIPAVQQDQAYVDPEIKALRDELSYLKAGQQQIETNAQLQRQQEVQTQIDLFREATDEAGKPLHPHFERVQTMMGSLISTGQAQDLKTAYDMAVYAHPEIRNELIEFERSAVAQKLNGERKAKVQDSKRAANNPKTTNTAPDEAPPEPDDVRASVRLAMQRSVL